MDSRLFSNFPDEALDDLQTLLWLALKNQMRGINRMHVKVPAKTLNSAQTPASNEPILGPSNVKHWNRQGRETGTNVNTKHVMQSLLKHTR